MKSTTRAIIEAAIAGDDSLSEVERLCAADLLTGRRAEFAKAAAADGRLLTFTEAATELGISRPTLREVLTALSADRSTPPDLLPQAVTPNCYRIGPALLHHLKNGRGKAYKPKPRRTRQKTFNRKGKK